MIVQIEQYSLGTICVVNPLPHSLQCFIGASEWKPLESDELWFNLHGCNYVAPEGTEMCTLSDGVNRYRHDCLPGQVFSNLRELMDEWHQQRPKHGLGDPNVKRVCMLMGVLWQ